jgi:UDPglucose 6-dehydrogenase
MEKSTRSRNLQIRHIAVFGLGKLGACIAGAMASRGFHVTGIDVDHSKTEALAKGVAPVEEPGLQRILRRAGSRLKATNDPREAVRHADASFFIPPTPSLPDGSFNNEYLLRAIDSAAKAVHDLGKRYHLFVVNSTVTPGTCDRILRPLLERILGGECGKRFGLCYNPEFIALGDVLHGLLKPDFVLIGQSDEASGAALERVYKRFCVKPTSVERMSNINAELAKISLNCAVTTKISFVNQLSALCAEIPCADPRVILGAIGRDRRIGASYLKPGLGFGGPCFPRDNRLFQHVARSVGVEASLAQATDKINENVNQRLLATVLANSADGGAIGVLGLAYKPFTAVVDCSPGVWLCQNLADHNRRVLAHDYLAGAGAAPLFTAGRVQICDDPRGLVQGGCQTFVITCPWPDYQELFAPKHVGFSRPGVVVVDPWNLLEKMASRLKNVRYITNLSSPTASTALPRLAAHV